VRCWTLNDVHCPLRGRCLLFVVRCSLFVVCCLLFVVCWLLCAVRGARCAVRLRAGGTATILILTTSPDDHTLPQLLFASLKSTTSIKLPFASRRAQLWGEIVVAMVLMLTMVLVVAMAVVVVVVVAVTAAVAVALGQ